MSKSDLDPPRVARRGVLAETSVHIQALCIEPCRRIHNAELDVVERVVRLEAELQAMLPISGQSGVLEHGKIEIVDTRAADRVLGRVADTEVRPVGRLNHLRAEMPVDGPLRLRQVGITGKDYAGVYPRNPAVPVRLVLCTSE